MTFTKLPLQSVFAEVSAFLRDIPHVHAMTPMEILRDLWEQEPDLFLALGLTEDGVGPDELEPLRKLAVRLRRVTFDTFSVMGSGKEGSISLPAVDTIDFAGVEVKKVAQMCSELRCPTPPGSNELVRVLWPEYRTPFEEIRDDED